MHVIQPTRPACNEPTSRLPWVAFCKSDLQWIVNYAASHGSKNFSNMLRRIASFMQYKMYSVLIYSPELYFKETTIMPRQKFAVSYLSQFLLWSNFSLFHWLRQNQAIRERSYQVDNMQIQHLVFTVSTYIDAKTEQEKSHSRLICCLAPRRNIPNLR